MDVRSLRTNNAPHVGIAELCGGLSRDRFIAILKEQGVPAFEGHVQPLYERPLFLDNADLVFGNRDPVFGNGSCPVTEEISRQRYISIMQPFFLGPDEWMDRLVELIRAIRDRAHDLIRR